MKSKSLFSGFIFIIILIIGLVWARAEFNPPNYTVSAIIGGVLLTLAIVISSAIKIADPWDKAVVLRLEHFQSLRGPGLFFIVPRHRYHSILD